MNKYNMKPFTRPIKSFKNGKLKMPGKTKYKWYSTPHRLVFKETAGEYQPIKLTKFDPGSRDKIRKWLKADLGFNFNTFTAKGTPRVDPDSLETLDNPAGQTMRKYLKLVKDLSQLATGAGSLIGNYRESSHTVTSRIDTNGTITGRYTSSKINLNQIPAQKEFRELFTAPTYYHVDESLHNKLLHYV